MSSLDHTEALARRVLETGGSKADVGKLAGAALGLVSRLRSVDEGREAALRIDEATRRIEESRDRIQRLFDDLTAKLEESNADV